MNIEDISKIKSSTGITNLFASEIKNSILDSQNEYLAKSPLSFTSLLLSGLGDLTANSFLEVMAYKREMHKNTAILSKSLVRYLTDEEIAGIFGQPSNATFWIGLGYDFLLKNAIIDPNSQGANIKKVRINKDSQIILLGKSIFRLDHSIDINILNWDTDNPTFNITYDLSDKYSDSFSNIVNPYINNRVVVKDGFKYVTFNVTAREYTRSYNTFTLDLTSLNEKIINYEDELMGFEVLTQSQTTGNFIRLTGYPEGVDTVDGYIFSLLSNGDTRSVKFTFNQNNNTKINTIIKIIIYTTTGSAANFKFPNMDADIQNNLSFVLQPDQANPFEQCISTITPIITTKSVESTGGKDQLTFTELQNYVINKSSNNKTITPADLEKKAAEYNCTIEKIRHDILLLYRLNNILTDENNDYIPSGSGTFKFNLNDVPLKSEIKARMLKPSFIYKHNKTEDIYYYQKNPVKLIDYLDDFRNNRENQVSFPFFIKMKFADIVKAEIWNLAAEDTYFTEIEAYDSYALDTVNIEKIYIERNPTIEKPTNEEINEGIEGFYSVSITAVIGKNIASSMIDVMQSQNPNKDYPMKFRLIIEDPVAVKTFYTDCELVDLSSQLLTIRYKAILYTNNNINDESQICLTNNTIKPVPINLINESFYYINNLVNMKLVILFQSEELYQYRNTIYDKYVTEAEKAKYYYVSTIYSTNNVKLAEDLTDKFNFTMDVKLNETQYKRYTETQYKTYPETIYERDEDNNIIYEKVIIKNEITGTEQTINKPKVLYSKGSFMLDDNGLPIKEHEVGDIIYNSNGDPEPIETSSNYSCTIRTVPWFDRIYNVSNKYFGILESYKNLINVHEAIKQVLIDGVDLSIGLKRTSGESKLYSIYDASSESYEYLDNLALSLDIGVKFDSVMSTEDKEYNSQLIVEKTKEYIYNHDSDVFSINEYLRYLKTEIPSISFLEHYFINKYDSKKCQTIQKDTSVSSIQNESLCVKMDIDEENSDFESEIIAFKPAINVTIL